MSRRRRRPNLPAAFEVDIEALSHEGRGIARVDGKTVFVFGALPGERVLIQVQKVGKSFDEATTLEIIEASAQRIQPKCAAFAICGGCSLQHLSNDDQIIFKQDSVVGMMAHAAIPVGEVIPALRGQHWGYRRKARLGVKYVRKKEKALVGFRERNSSFLADMSRCEVLIPEVGHKLELFAQLIESLQAREQIPQIEVAADADNIQLVFRHLQTLCEADIDLILEFGKHHGFNIQLQPAGPDSVVNLYPPQQALYFNPLQDSDIRIAFNALDFVQVNSELNQKMVAQALHYLDLQADDNVLDLFCGLGNFTLPMAQRCAKVTGIEGDNAMVERAEQSARALQINNSEYHAVDLSRPDSDHAWMKKRYDKILLDPPRSGAQEIASQIKRFKACRIIYVSCQPSSLVRDAAIICAQGYRLSHLGVMDMFPQTAHVESMAVFECK